MGRILSDWADPAVVAALAQRAFTLSPLAPACVDHRSALLLRLAGQAGPCVVRETLLARIWGLRFGRRMLLMEKSRGHRLVPG